MVWDASAESLGIGTSTPASVSGGTSIHGTLTLGSGDGSMVVGDVTGALSFSTFDASYTGTYADGITGEIASVAESSVGGAYGLAFYTATTTGSNRAERMRIDSSGNVGIGTNSPVTDLDVRNNISMGDGTSVTNLSMTRNSANYITASNAAGYLAFRTGGSTERMRIDTSGNLLVGKTSSGSNIEGVELLPQGAIYAVRSSNVTGVFNRKTSDGEIVHFRKDGTTVGSIGVALSDNLYLSGVEAGIGFGTGTVYPATTTGQTSDNDTNLGTASTRFKDLYLSGAAYVATDGVLSETAEAGSTFYFSNNNIGLKAYSYITSNRLIPCDENGANRDNYVDLGQSNARFDDIYAANGTIQTSDRNEKQDIAELSDAEQRVAVACKGLLRKFRWKSAVEEKGDEARIHFGIIAQDLQAAFAAEGLDAGDYGMFISTTWTDEETNEEKTRLGVRYSELLAFIISAL